MAKESSSSAVGSTISPEALSAVNGLSASLDRRRMYREVTLSLRSGLRDASADFSFLRLRGLRSLLGSLDSLPDSDEAIRLFRHSQSLPQLQVVPTLFASTLRELQDDPVVNLDHIFGVEPMKINSPATDAEIALALRVLEGCCLLHQESVDLAHQQKAIKVLLSMLSTRGMLVQGSCLDALISLMMDSSANQMDFEACHGIEKIAELIKDEQMNEIIRLKCAEFLLLQIGHVSGRREESPLANIQEDIRQLLGEKCASLVWTASQFGSTLDPYERHTSLHIQARRVLKSLDINGSASSADETVSYYKSASGPSNLIRPLSYYNEDD